MEDFLSNLRELEQAGAAAIAATSSPEELDSVRVKYVGRKAQLTRLLRSVRELPQEQRPQAGAEANRVKLRLQEALDRRAAEFTGTPAAAADEIDLTLPGRDR